MCFSTEKSKRFYVSRSISAALYAGNRIRRADCAYGLVDADGFVGNFCFVNHVTLFIGLLPKSLRILFFSSTHAAGKRFLNSEPPMLIGRNV